MESSETYRQSGSTGQSNSRVSEQTMLNSKSYQSNMTCCGWFCTFVRQKIIKLSSAPSGNGVLKTLFTSPMELSPIEKTLREGSRAARLKSKSVSSLWIT